MSRAALQVVDDAVVPRTHAGAIRVVPSGVPHVARRHAPALGAADVEAPAGMLKPDLTIVDGSVGQDGEGPLYGEKADLQVLVAGRDSLAVDLACCQLVGIIPRTIPHLKLALEQLGRPSWKPVGEDVGVIKQFASLSRSHFIVSSSGSCTQ